MASIKTQALLVYEFFERIIVLSLLVLLVVMVLWGTWLLAQEIVGTLAARLAGAPPVSEAHLHEFLERFGMLHSVFSAFLLLLIGVELMKTVVMYLDRHELHVEVVFTVAMIAVARHAIGIDIEKTPGLTLVGMGVLTLALAVGYHYFQKATRLRVGADQPGTPARGAGGEVL